jgi:hypothetical protein
MIYRKSIDGLTRTERMTAEAFDRWPPGKAMADAHIRSLMGISSSIDRKPEIQSAGQKQFNADDVGALADLIKSIRAEQKRLQAWADGRLGHLMSDGAKEAFQSTASMMDDIISDNIKPAIYELDAQWMEDRT